MIELGILLVAGIILLILDLLSVATRAAYLGTNHARLLGLREGMETQVNQALQILPVLPRLQGTLDLSLVVYRVLLAGLALFYLLGLPFQEPVLTALGILLAVAFVLFWIEWLVDRSILKSPDLWAVRLSAFARGLMFFLAWLVWLPLRSSWDIQNGQEPVSTVTEDELKTLVDAGQEEGIFESDERRMIYSIFQLGDTLAREIMVPRIDMLALDVNTPMTEAVDSLLRSGHSRVPVFEETVDNTLGLLYAKDLLRVWREGNQLESLRDLLRPAYFVPEAKKVDELLAEMQSQRVHMAIVVDEYGGVAGLVTLEDIIEEVVGEIRDEYDQAEESPYQVMKNGEYLFQGRVDVDDFNEIMGSDLPVDEADTIGGLIYNRIGRVPAAGETVQQNGLLLIVEQVSGRRIRKVRARWLPHELESEEDTTQNGING